MLRIEENVILGIISSDLSDISDFLNWIRKSEYDRDELKCVYDARCIKKKKIINNTRPVLLLPNVKYSLHSEICGFSSANKTNNQYTTWQVPSEQVGESVLWFGWTVPSVFLLSSCCRVKLMSPSAALTLHLCMISCISFDMSWLWLVTNRQSKHRLLKKRWF